jgi:uncharacterized membrane protein
MSRKASGPGRKNYLAVKVFVAVWLGLAALTAAIVPANASTLIHSAEALLQLVDAEVLLILLPFTALLLFILAEAARQTARGNRPREARQVRRRLSWSRS